MSQDFSDEPPSARRNRASSARARSIPYRRPYIFAAFLFALFFLGIIATCTSLVLFLLHPTTLGSRILLAAIVFAGATWLLSYFRRTSAFCPLCKGTPLLHSGAAVHINASRIPPFNHGASAIISIIAAQQFRCMHCGTRYDLLKRTARERNKEVNDAAESGG